MADTNNGERTPTNGAETRTIPNPITELVESFRALKGAPAGFWYANLSYWLDGVAYFGMLTLLTMFLHDIVHLSDRTGHRLESIYTGLITGSMLVFGPLVEKISVRRSLIISVLLFIAGRTALTLAPTLFGGQETVLFLVTVVALVVAALGNGFMQPAVYAGVKLYTTEKTAAMGYALLYAGMNLGIVLIGLLSARIRTGLYIPGVIDFDGYGIVGVFWFCIGVNVLMLVLLLLFFTRRVEREAQAAGQPAKEDPEPTGDTKRPAVAKSPLEALKSWYANSPVSNSRFMFFIFALMPVQTLFAYNWLVMPQYVTRAYSQLVADNMEMIVNVSNPLIIVLGVPIITAMTRRVNVYRMMVIGSLVSALPAFIFCAGPNFYLLMAYIVVFSIGEALWQPRFLQFAAELAPKGQTGAYIAYANIPWFAIKSVAGFYTGVMMERFCPADSVQDTETMWWVYAAIASLSPILLIVARRWVHRGPKTAGPGV